MTEAELLAVEEARRQRAAEETTPPLGDRNAAKFRKAIERLLGDPEPAREEGIEPSLGYSGLTGEEKDVLRAIDARIEEGTYLPRNPGPPVRYWLQAATERFLDLYGKRHRNVPEAALHTKVHRTDGEPSPALAYIAKLCREVDGKLTDEMVYGAFEIVRNRAICTVTAENC